MRLVKFSCLATLALLALSGCERVARHPAPAVVQFNDCPIGAEHCKVCKDGVPEYHYRARAQGDLAMESQSEEAPHRSEPVAGAASSSTQEKALSTSGKQDWRPRQNAEGAAEPVWKRIQSNKKIVIGVKADTPPFSVQSEDGSFWGFEADLARYIAQTLGLDVELIPVTAKERVPVLLQDKSDLVIATMTLTKKREDLVDYSLPYFQVGQGLITQAESSIQGFQDLDGYKVAVLEGTQAFHTLSRIQPGCQLIIVHSYEEGLKKVISDEVKALCSDHLILLGLYHSHATPEKLALVEQTFAPDNYGVAMRENESSLRDAVNLAIMKSWEEGYWQDAYETWFGQGSMYAHELDFRVMLFPE